MAQLIASFQGGEPDESVRSGRRDVSRLRSDVGASRARIPNLATLSVPPCVTLWSSACRLHRCFRRFPPISPLSERAHQRQGLARTLWERALHKLALKEVKELSQSTQALRPCRSTGRWVSFLLGRSKRRWHLVSFPCGAPGLSSPVTSAVISSSNAIAPRF